MDSLEKALYQQGIGYTREWEKTRDTEIDQVAILLTTQGNFASPRLKQPDIIWCIKGFNLNLIKPSDLTSD